MYHKNKLDIYEHVLKLDSVVVSGLSSTSLCLYTPVGGVAAVGGLWLSAGCGCRRVVAAADI